MGLWGSAVVCVCSPGYLGLGFELRYRIQGLPPTFVFRGFFEDPLVYLFELVLWEGLRLGPSSLPLDSRKPNTPLLSLLLFPSIHPSTRSTQHVIIIPRSLRTTPLRVPFQPHQPHGNPPSPRNLGNGTRRPRTAPLGVAVVRESGLEGSCTGLRDE